MADLVYGTSSFERQRGDFPALPVINMLAENVPTEPGVALQSRPGLKYAAMAAGSGPVRGLYTADGVLSNALFSVSGSSVYRNSNALGSLTGTGYPSFGAYEDFIFFNAGAEIKKYDGTDYTDVEFPDDANVVKVLVAQSRLLAIRADTGVFYWSGPLGTEIDALDFATAEDSPDRLKDALWVGSRLVLFGSETVEFWQPTGDSESPFVPLIGAVYPVGVKATGAATEFDKGFAWITNHNEVCLNDPKAIVSEPELQVRIRDSETVSLWTFYIDDNEFLAVRLDGETWVYGARSQVWSKFESYGEDNWICQCYDGGYFGGANDGKLIEWDDTSVNDFGNSIKRGFRAWAALTSENLIVSNIVLRTNPGTTVDINPAYPDPVVSLRTSRDGGHSWQPWKERSLGQRGDYRRKVYWSSLGQFGYPGLLVDIRVTDPVAFRASGLSFNEPFGGR